MSRGAATDSAGFADTTLKLNGSATNPSIEKAEALNERGDIVMRDTFNPLTAPTTDYVVIGTFDLATLILGTKSASNNVLTGFAVTTSAGEYPKISTTENSVPSASAEDATYTTPAGNVAGTATAQILFGAFTLTGTGCHTSSCNANGSCTLVPANDESGVMVAFGVHGAKIEMTAEITQTGATAPTVTPATGWIVTAPLAKTETNTDYVKWSVGLEYIPAIVVV